jgi:hypothetical protein
VGKERREGEYRGEANPMLLMGELLFSKEEVRITRIITIDTMHEE